MAPVSHEQYVLADGSSIMKDTTVGQLEFEGKIVGGTIVFGDAHAEPLPGPRHWSPAGSKRTRARRS